MAEPKPRPAPGPVASPQEGGSVARVRAALAAAGHPDTIRAFPEGTRTAEDAARAVGCSVGEIAKSLVFRQKGSARPALVIVSGADRVDLDRLAAILGAPIERAEGRWVREVTGFAIGGVAPLAHLTPPLVLIDARVMALSRVWAAAGSPAHVFETTPERLLAPLRRAGSRGRSGASVTDAAIRPLADIDGEAFAALAAAARAEGHHFLDRMLADWHAGITRFDRPGEVVLAAWVGDTLAGLVARGRDPHSNDPTVGRLRHLYVRPEMRGKGIGPMLARAALAGAEEHFRLIRVRLGPDHAAAAAMYLALGFVPIAGDPFATHALALRPGA